MGAVTVDVDLALLSPEDRREVEELERAVAENPLYVYRPHDKQRPFHAAKAALKVFLGGNRSGKSTCGFVDDIIQAIDPEACPPHLLKYKKFMLDGQPFRCRIVIPDFKQPFKAAVEVIRRWVPKAQLKGGSWETAFQKKDYVLEFENGSFFEFMTYEQDLDKFGGSTRDRIHYDEEPDGEKGEAIREECSMRLIESVDGDELFTFTPLNGLGWTFDEFEEAKGPEVEKHVWLDDEMIVVRSSIRDNREHIDLDKARARLAKLPERVRKAREDGEFIHFKGLVYPMFDHDLHVVATPAKRHVRSLEQFDGIDPGINTTAILFGGFDRDNCLLIYDELYLSDRWAIPENAAPLIFDKRQHWGLPKRPYRTLIDPAGRNRELGTGDKVENHYYRAGVKTIRANNDVEPGVFEVMRRLEHRDAEGEPVPLVLIAENCVNLLREINRYRQKPKEDGSFGVVKHDDHGCDVLRYICQARPLAPTPLAIPNDGPERWTPGTAPPYRGPKPQEVGPMGPYS